MDTLQKLQRLPIDVINIGKHTDTSTFLRYMVCMAISAPQIVKTRTFESSDRRMKGRNVHFRVGPQRNKTMQWNGDYFAIAREVCCRRPYFVIDGFDIKPDECVVDLGANVGSFTTLAALSGRKVIAVEAQPQFIPVIRANVADNNCSEKVEVELGLIGSHAGVLSDPEALKRVFQTDTLPPVLTMTELIKKHSLSRIDFLKIDIEGSEFDLLINDNGWLSSVNRIAMEVHPKFGNESDIVSSLKAAGFQVWLVDNYKRTVPSLQAQVGFLFARRP
jgi:FkbM family methyltransferase